METEKTIQGVRQYFHSSLSARLNTLPFLTKIEKKWITYQLLVYLEKAEKWGLFHGDLKCENVMLTSWNWIFITDHAFCYKPIYLPAQNYGGFSYFFDTSNRTCYMAPERFGGSDETGVGNSANADEVELKLSEKRAKMDIFSMGCVIAELWLEQDRRLFEYGSMLRYKDGSDEPLNILQNIQEPGIRQLVTDMVHRDPEKRRSAVSYLRQWTGTLFPSYFETLHDAISKILTAHPNERVRRISLSLEDLHKLFTDRQGVPSTHASFVQSSLPPQLKGLASPPLSSSSSSAPFVDAYAPFEDAPFSSPDLPSKTDSTAISAAIQPLLTDDARLEFAVKIPGLPTTGEPDTFAEALRKAGHLDEDKLQSLIETCNSADALLPIAKLLESILKKDSLFELPRPRPNANASALGTTRVAPEFNRNQLPKDETRFLDGQGGLMSATLATEHLLRKLLVDQENDRMLRDIDVNSYTSEEIQNIIGVRSIDLVNGTPADAALLGMSQSELQCRKLLDECYIALEGLNNAYNEAVQAESTSPSTPEKPATVSASQHSMLMERKEIEQKLMIALEMLSTLFRERGEFRHALAFQRAFLGRAKHWKDSISLLRGFQQYGLTYHIMGDHENAIRSYKQALTFANNLKSKRHLLDLFHLLGEAYADKSDLQTATYYHGLFEDLQGELKGAADDVIKGNSHQSNRNSVIHGSSVSNSNGASSPSFARGAISVTTHKLLSATPTRTPGRLPSQSVSAASLQGSPAPFSGISTPQKPTSTARFSMATAALEARSLEMLSAVAEYLPPDEPGTLGYVIILDILCAMLPYLTDTSLKLTCLDCLARISHYADDEVRLQRLVPTLVSYLDSTRDPSALVRAQTIKTLAHIISLVNEFPIDDAHIFQDYLIPVLKFVLKEERETIVHQAFAAALPKLAKSARLCLDHSQLHRTHHRSATGTGSSGSGSGLDSSSQVPRDPRKKDSGYADDLHELRQEFHNILNEWLENSSLIVKRTVLEDIGTLAEFFGSEDTNNHLLQLIFSWLNFSDWELKCAVFDNIVGVSQVAGPNAIESYIESYLPIHDESEFVIDSAVNCLASLTEAGIFSPQKLREYSIQVAPLLLHPNAWIRFATVQFLSKISRRLSPIEVQCFIIPHIRRFLKQDITSLSHTTLLQAMIPPVSRSAYEKVMTSLNLNSTAKESVPLPVPSSAPVSLSTKPTDNVGVLSATATADGSSNSNNVRRLNLLSGDTSLSDFVVIEPNASVSPSTPKIHHALATSMTSDGDKSGSIDLAFSLGLAELDLEGQDEEKLFWMKEYVKEARRTRIDKRSTLTTDSWASEYTRLSKEKTVHDIAQFLTPVQTAASALLPSLETNGPDEPTELWKAMFGSTSSSGISVASTTSNAAPTSSSNLDNPSVKAVAAMTGTIPSSTVVAPHPVSATQEDDPKVTVMVGSSTAAPAPTGSHENAPLSSGRDYGSGPIASAPGSSNLRSEPNNQPLNLGPIRASKLSSSSSATSAWTPQGLLVATLSEHEEAVTQLQVARDGAFFASGSHDKKVKIWDSAQFEHNGPLRSACTYYGLGSAVTSISICQDSHSVAAASINGSIHVFRVDAGSNLPKGSSAPPGTTSATMTGNANGGVVGVPGSLSANTSGIYNAGGSNTVGSGGAVSGSGNTSYGSGMTATVVRRLDQTDGVILKVEHYDKGADSLIVYATDRGDIRSWDLRTQKEPWAVSNSPHLGLITSLLIDPQRNWLAVGTDAGNFTCWDLRFRVPLLNWSLPTFDGLCGVHSLAADPLQNGGFWASFGPGLVGHWSLDTKQCSRVLRVAPREFSSALPTTPSTGPNAHDWDSLLVPKEDAASSGDDFRIADLQRPLTESARSLEAHLNTIRAMSVSPNGNFIVTGGADKKLRFWNFDNPTKSFIISGKDPKEDVTYNAWESNSKTIAGLEEVRTPIRESPHIVATQQLPSSGHCDTILDTKLLELHSKKVMVVSASRDGVIKVWK